MKRYGLLLLNILTSIVVLASNFTPPGLYKPTDESKMQSIWFELQWFYPTGTHGETIVYDLYFGTDPNPPLYRENLISVNGPINSEETEYTFDATMTDAGVTKPGMVFLSFNPLAYEATYYWKVVAKKQSGESQTSELFSFSTTRENTLPTAPSLISPANRTENVSRKTTLEWTKSIDVDGDEVTYAVYLKRGSSGNMVKIAADLKTNSYIIPYDLNDQEIYYWYVVALDGYSGETVMHDNSDNIWDFTVENYINDAPASFQLGFPLDGALNTSWSVTLSWNEPVDKDGDLLFYDIYLDENTNPTSLLVADVALRTKQVQLEKKYTTYYWKVVAKDGKGGETESAVHSFQPWKNSPTEFIEMVKVEGGSFNMGQPDPNIGYSGNSSDEQPVHAVNLDSYLIGKYEVTWAQFCDFLNSIKGSVSIFKSTFLPITTYVKFKSQEDNIVCAISESQETSFPDPGFDDPKIYWDGSSFVVKEGFENYPVENMTNYGARLFCDWAGVRLPTEAEWEYAAKGGNKSQGYTYSGSNALDQVGWYSDNAVNPYNPMISYHMPVSGSGNGTHESGAKLPNELGIFDMSGNVSELVNDWYLENYYEISPTDNPRGPESMPENNPAFIFRGGNWLHKDYQARNCLRYQVQYVDNYTSKNFWGFRVVGKASENGAPGKVSLLLPTDNTAGIDETIELSWQNVVDPDGDIVAYDVYVGTKIDPVTRIAKNTTLTAVNFSDLNSNTTYYWKVIAKDNKGNIAEESTVWKFTTANISKYTFSGTVLSEFGTPVKDVELLGFGSKVTTDADGKFSVQVSKGWTGIVRPFKLDYSFTPENIEINNMDQSLTNFAITAKYTHTYAISVQIKDANGQFMSNVQVKVGNNMVSPWNNWYIAYQNAGWSGTIKPSLAGYTFSPDNIEVNILEEDMQVLFTAAYVGAHTISGTVVDDAGNGISGVALSGFSNTVITDASGKYTTTENKGWSGTIKPQLNDHIFTPAQLTFSNLVVNSFENNFVGSPNNGLFHSVSGTISDDKGDPLSNVDLIGFSNTVITNANGEYIATEHHGWNGTITPQLEGYTFTPKNIKFSNLTATSSENNFIGVADAPKTYLISGTIYDGKGNPLSNVTLNGFSNMVITNALGEYHSIANNGWSGTITPQLDGFSFIPEKLTIQNLNAFVEQDFTGSSIVTSIIDPETKFSYKIYPNPSSGEFTIDVSEKTSIQIFTIDGKEVLNKTINDKILVSLKKKGLYIVKVILKGEEYYQKIIIR